MIIGVVHKDRELTISRLWSFNRNDPEMNDFFLCIQNLHNKLVFYTKILGMRGACYKNRLRHKLILILTLIGMSYESKKNAHI